MRDCFCGDHQGNVYYQQFNWGSMSHVELKTIQAYPPPLFWVLLFMGIGYFHMLEFDLLWSSSLGVYRLISVLMFLFCNLCVQSLVLFSWAAYCGGCTSLPLPSLKREWLTDYMHTSFIVVEIQKYLEYINTLEYEDQPDYEFIRKLFREGLKKRGCTDDGKNVKFTTSKASSASADLPNGYSSAGEVCMLLLIFILSGEILSWALVGVKGFATNSLWTSCAIFSTLKQSFSIFVFWLFHPQAGVKKTWQ